MRHIVIAASLAPSKFRRYLMNGTIFGEKLLCVLIFPTTLFVTFPIIIRIKQDIAIM